MTEPVVPGRPGPAGPAKLCAAARRRGLALRGYAHGPARAGPPGFGNTSAGSPVEWNVPEAKMFFDDLATDKPLPKNLIAGASVAGAA